MRTLPLFFILIIVSCTTEQKTDCNYITDYYQTVYQADYEFEIENYVKAFELYELAFNSCEAKNTPSYNELGKFAEVSAILKEYDLTYAYAKKQIQYGVELNSFYNKSNYAQFLSTDIGEKFVSEYDSLRREFLYRADFKLRDELIEMKSADQMFRMSSDQEHITKQDSIDKLHEARLIEIIENVGYPDDKIIGPHTYEYQTNVLLLLLHTDDSIRMNYFVPKVKEFVIAGTAPPIALGTMIDQYYLYNGEPQIYGTYQAQEGGYAYMIDDLQKVDSNRISIGLPPLALTERKDSLNRIKYGF